MHQTFDFFPRTTPIFGGEGIDGQVLNSKLNASGNDVAQILGASAMTGQTR